MSDGASAAQPKGPTLADPFVGRVICDRFKITGLIARGGMGSVYRAEQAPLGRVCAIKVLNPGGVNSLDPEFHKRFFLEASIASKLTHPNTVTIFDYGRTEDHIYYMAMEYLDGRTLHRAIRQAGFMPEERVAHIARQICRAVHEAHVMGVIHRDLKPANIYLVEHGDEADFVKVLDFGLVKLVSDTTSEELTQVGLFMGSPKYMAPEQVRGERVDARTDVYALGVILYEMAAGRVPFDRPNSVQILMAHVHEPPPLVRQTNPQSQISPALEEIIQKCMAKSPSLRFGSMEELLAELKRAPRASSVSIVPTIQGNRESAGRAVAPSGSGPNGSRPMPGETSSSSSSAPIPTASPATGSLLAWQQPVRKKSKKAIAAGVLAVAAVGGVASVAALRSGHSDGRSPLSESSARATDVGVTAAASPSPPFDTIVKFRITTDPDGATVKENGVAICSGTPCDVLYAEADPSRVHRIVLTLAGYQQETKDVRIEDSPVVVKLTVLPSGEPRSKTSKP
jgi:serine/threonine-protein kinase